MTDLKPILELLARGEPLTESAAAGAFEIILGGRSDDAQIGAFLGAIAARGGPTVDELVGAARILRRQATCIPRLTAGPFAGARILDTCGTGGAPKLFNISTIAAIIIAAAGHALPRQLSHQRIALAKHGNTSRTGRGSAELMQGLGVNIHASPQAQARCLSDLGICFCLAPAHHPAARHAAQARKSLGFPTIFNLLGPLASPMAAMDHTGAGGSDHQLIGTWSHRNARLLAESLARLSPPTPPSTPNQTRDHAWTYCSRDGFDELVLSDTIVINRIRPGHAQPVTTFELDARDLGLPRTPAEAVQTRTLDESIRAARGVISGERGPFRDYTLLSAAAGLHIGGRAASLADGLAIAAESIDSGHAARTLDGLIKATRSE